MIQGRGHHRGKRSRQDRVAQHRRGIKQILVSEAGECCAICGHQSNLGALQFHRVNPVAKRIEINRSGAILSHEAMRAEAAKCVLLCANCHAEVGCGSAVLPVR